MNLKIDYCSYEAAKYACTNWHYSKSMPAGKIVKFGAWEDDKFIGCILYSRGANNNLGQPYGVDCKGVCELTRVALTKHKTPVSKILAITLRLIRKHSPGLKIVVSYADGDQEHHGGIYQASNWIYEGVFCKGKGGRYVINGQSIHRRTLFSKYGTSSVDALTIKLKTSILQPVGQGKHRYIYPLTEEMQKQVNNLAKPYPKRQKKAMDDLSSQRECDTHLAAPLKLTGKKAELEAK